VTAAAYDVAIVGGGASGTMLAIQLLRRRTDARFLMLDRAGDFARGIAYRTAEPTHLLNVPAGRMSALPDDEGHFLRWLQQQQPSAGPDSYARRTLYGNYLAQLLAAEQGAAWPSTVLELRRSEVCDVTKLSEGFRLRMDTGDDVLARHAVLALGNFLPAPLPASAAAATRIWKSPWASDVSWPASEASVLLVGTSLTAVDVLLSLLARGHRGRVHLLSRHGLLPNAHQTPSSPPLEFEHLPEGRLCPLVRLLREAAAGTDDWRAAVDGLRPHTHRLWRALPDPERRRFARHVRTHWEVHRHRLAPEVEQRVQALVLTGQAQLLAGRLLALDTAGSRLEARFRKRGGGAPEELLQVDAVVNCTGPPGHSLQADALVGALLRVGLAQPGPLGLGLATDDEGRVLDAGGRVLPNLWAMGAVRRGELWESTAVPDIRHQAAALAGRLASERFAC
jgi:uncharacterized NAD(P)/FAD-binding protein YdhS